MILLLALVLAGRPSANAAEAPEAAKAFARELLAADAATRSRLLDDRSGETGPDLVQALFDVGNEMRAGNDLSGALSAFEIAKAMADGKGLARESGRARQEAAYVLSVFGRYTESLALVEEARRIYQQIGDGGREARTIVNRGILSRYTGDLDGALAAYAEARQRAEALGDGRLVRVTLNNTAVVHLSRGDLRKALDALEQALSTKEGPEDQLSADILGNLGAVHTGQGNLELGIDYLKRSLAIQEKLGNAFGTIHERGNLGGALWALGRVAEARATLEEAAALGEKAGAPDEASRARIHLSRLLIAEGRLDDGAMEAERAVALGRASNLDALVAALSVLAEIDVRRGRPESALRAAEEALGSAERMSSERRQAEAWYAKGLALTALGRDDEAADAFERSIQAIESQREHVAGAESERQRFLESRVAPYEGLLELHARHGRAEAALAQAERARARTLVDALSSRRTRLDTLLGPEEQERQRGLRETLARAGAEAQRQRQKTPPDAARLAADEELLSDARHKYEAFRIAAFASHPEMRARSGQAAPWRLDDTRSLLDDRTLVVAYAVTDERTHLFALSRAGGLRRHALGVGRRALEQQTRAFRQALADRELGLRVAARRLCDTLLGPVRAQLRASTRLLVVPDGPLWELPFQALECSPGRYILEERAVAYAPSLTALREMSRRTPSRAAPASLLALGDPLIDEGRRRQMAALFRDATLGPLPEAAGEVQALGRLYGRRSVVYVGEDARESRVKAEAPRHRLLHFAAHGILNDASPLYSQLVLARPAPGDADDGLLEAWEIMEMDLAADLAVLSACETGRGRVGRGEGLIGMSWAFSVAGCPTTVVSQWKVDSSSTSRLMLEFHRRLAAGRPKAEALRAAALAVKADPRRAHPFYWAGFIVVGLGWESPEKAR